MGNGISHHHYNVLSFRLVYMNLTIHNTVTRLRATRPIVVFKQGKSKDVKCDKSISHFIFFQPEKLLEVIAPTNVNADADTNNDDVELQLQ